MKQLILIATICFSGFALAESISIEPDLENDFFLPHPTSGEGEPTSDENDPRKNVDDRAGDDDNPINEFTENEHSDYGPPPPPPAQLCPNLFPSWLPNYETPACIPTSQDSPWIDTPEYQANAQHTLLSPPGDYFVSCNGAEVVSLGENQQKLVSSLSGFFGGSFDVEPPCQVLPTLFCGGLFGSAISEETIATAAANAYVSLDAFYSYFSEKHDWQGLNNEGRPINAEFGNDVGLWTHGWNSSSQSATFCPGAIIHINVWAHELFHGIVEATTQFQYNNFTSSGGIGAREINEAYADFFAEMVQFNAGINDTSIIPGSPGDYIVTTGKNETGAAGPFYDQARPCHSDPWVGSQNYYVNGGPIRHMMYLLAEGTNPALLPHSDVCQGPTYLEGIGREEASNVWFDALVNCDWRADGELLSHCDARRCTLEAASCGTVRETVRNAWNAVELTAEACGIENEILPECPPPPLAF